MHMHNCWGSVESVERNTPSTPGELGWVLVGTSCMGTYIYGTIYVPIHNVSTWVLGNSADYVQLSRAILNLFRSWQCSLNLKKMSDFGFSSSSTSNSSSGMNGAQRAELMEQVKSQLLVASLQELLSVSGLAVHTCMHG